MAIKPSLLTDTKRYPSPIIWGQTKFEETLRDMAYGLAIKDDFESFHGTIASNVGTHFSRAGGWVSYVDTGGALAMLTTSKVGEVAVTTSSTDNHESNVQLGGAGQLAIVAGQRFAYEQRIRLSSVTSGNFFIGFVQEGAQVADGIFSDAGALADKDYLGFSVLEASATSLNFTYNTASGGGAVVNQAAAKTMAIDTMVKIGFVGNGSTIQGYIDGAKIGTAFAYTASNVPVGEEMCLTMSAKNGAAAARSLYSDWFQFWAQVAN